jgi:general secretion pathway protein D
VDWITVWVDQLDTPEAAGDSMQSFIYQVKNSNAKELGAVIGQVIGQQSSDSAETENAAAVGQGQAGRPGLRMVVDETRNSLVFIGSAGEYAIAYQLLQELDLPAKQVLIEVTIADISLDKTSQLGVEWQFTDYNSNGEINNVISTLGGLGAGSAGLLFTAFDSRGDVKVRLNALAEDGDARILSNPKLLALDNEEARIQVGQQIAVISSEIADTNSPTPGAGDNVLRTFNYIDTGVILSFTPTVMADGIVRLKVYQEVSSAGPSLDNTPPINKRTIETTLVAHSGQTVMIGGLITHNTTSQENKVPVLGDLPILGGLFKSTQKTDTSSEMIVLITPHVIESAAQAAQLTQAFREQLDW